MIGPDEYKEHVNNNAYTNYFAHWNIKKAIEYYGLLKERHLELFECLGAKLKLDKFYPIWVDRIEQIYLPKPREGDLLIPQDDTYLTLKTIDLTKYKKQEQVRSIYKDYGPEQISQIQVSKQADTLLLFYLLEDLFSPEVRRANWDYYEPKTLHDSSLSLSTHCVLASDMGDEEMAYELFGKIREIDLGPNMKSSDQGVHAASLGGIWQSVVNGFGGVRMIDGGLRISPRLPKAWTELSFRIHWWGGELEVRVTKDELVVVRKTEVNEDIALTVYGREYRIVDELRVGLR